MSNFVDHGVTRSLEPNGFVLFGRPFSVTVRVPDGIIVPVEGEYAASLAHICESEDKVPFISWVDVNVCNS